MDIYSIQVQTQIHRPNEAKFRFARRRNPIARENTVNLALDLESGGQFSWLDLLLSAPKCWNLRDLTSLEEYQ